MRTTRPGSVQPSTRTRSPPLSSIAITPEVGVALCPRTGSPPSSGDGSSATATGANVNLGAALPSTRRSAIRPFANACRRQPNSWLALTPRSRATCETELPGRHASATSRSFSSSLQRRRRSGPVMISTRPLIALPPRRTPMNMHRRYRQTRAVPQGGSHRRDTPYYGLFANDHRAANIPRARELLGAAPRIAEPEEHKPTAPGERRILPCPCRADWLTAERRPGQRAVTGGTLDEPTHLDPVEASLGRDSARRFQCGAALVTSRRCSGIRRVRQRQTTQCSQTKGP